MSTDDELKELSKNYEFGPMWREDADAANAHFKVVFQDVDHNTSYVEAQANTGTRYAVFCTEMPFRVRDIHEATHVFSIVHPKPRTVLLHIDLKDQIHLSYIREKLDIEGLVHGGDLMALGLTMMEGVRLLKAKAGIETRVEILA